MNEQEQIERLRRELKQIRDDLEPWRKLYETPEKAIETEKQKLSHLPKFMTGN